MNQQSGYTLIELLLYIVTVGLLLSGVAAFFALTTDARIKNQSISEVNEQGMFVIETISQTVRNSTSISSPLAAASASQLSLVVPTANLSPTVFALTNGTITIKEGAAVAVPLTSPKVTVSSFTVTNLTRSGTAGIVRIGLTLNRVNDSGRNQYDYQRTFTTSVGLRL